MPALLPQATVRSRWLFVRGALNLGRGPGHRLLVAMRLRARPGRARLRAPDRQLPGAQLPVTLVQAPPRPAVAHLGAWASWALTHTARRRAALERQALLLKPVLERMLYCVGHVFGLVATEDRYINCGAYGRNYVVMVMAIVLS